MTVPFGAGSVAARSFDVADTEEGSVAPFFVEPDGVAAVAIVSSEGALPLVGYVVFSDSFDAGGFSCTGLGAGWISTASSIQVSCVYELKLVYISEYYL